jgi:hypothetical protein
MGEISLLNLRETINDQSMGFEAGTTLPDMAIIYPLYQIT